MSEKKIAEQAMAYKIEDDKVHYYLNCYDFTVDEDKKQREEKASFSLHVWEIALTERVMCIYKEKDASFRKALYDALTQDDYIIVKFPCGELRYKKVQKCIYRFVYIFNDTYYYFECTLREFLIKFDPKNANYCGYASKTKNEQMEMYKPLRQSAIDNNDKYITSFFNYYINSFTKEDVDIINEAEDGDILFVVKRLYDVNDVLDIRNVKLCRKRYFANFIEWYAFEVKLECKYYKAVFNPKYPNEIQINCRKNYIYLTNELSNKLKIIFAGTEKQQRTRRLMQAGNYLYANEKGIGGLTPEAQNRIYTDMMQVSLEDLKELYSYHLDLLSILQLTDWLWASGNLENKKAYDFVFDIAKQRKQTDYFLKLIETTHQK